MHKVFELEIFNRVVKYTYNRFYINYNGLSVENKTSKIRLCVSEEIVFEKEVIFLTNTKKKLFDVVIQNERTKIRLSSKKTVRVNGTYRVNIYIKPKAVVPIADILSIDGTMKFQENAITQKESSSYSALFREIKNASPCVLYIGDEFTKEHLSSRENVVDIGYEDMKILAMILQQSRKDIRIEYAFIESLWQGKDASFDLFSTQNRIDRILEYIQLFKINDIKILFFNKEDPTHFDYFLPVAKASDYVLTIERSCIEKYVASGVLQAEYVNFFVDPSISNPFQREGVKLSNSAIFAGSYYPAFLERSRFMQQTFPLINKIIGLDIIDRNYGKSFATNQFPPMFSDMIIGGNRPLREVSEIIQHYKYVVNVNTNTTEESMVARRVFDCLAQGKVIISNYATSIEALGLPVHMINEGEEAADALMEIKKSAAETANLRQALDIYEKYSTRVAVNKIHKMLSIQRRIDAIIIMAENNMSANNFLGMNIISVKKEEAISYEDSYLIDNFQGNEKEVVDLIHIMDALGNKYEKIKFNSSGCTVYKSYKKFLMLDESPAFEVKCEGEQ